MAKKKVAETHTKGLPGLRRFTNTAWRSAGNRLKLLLDKEGDRL